MKKRVFVVGAGLAGSEVSLHLAEKGYKVILFEQRSKADRVFKTDYFAELVCSNSFGSYSKYTASGLLKREMLVWGSLLLKIAFRNRVVCGKALCVDPLRFSKDVTRIINEHPNIKVYRKRVEDIPGKPIVIATGPLTDGLWAEKIKALTGEEFLYFYDAVSPIVLADSIDYSKGFWGARYEEKKDYFNCPLTDEEYRKFYNELIKADVVSIEEHEKSIFFEACLPIEEIARRGEDTPLFGPLKPVGFKRLGKDVVAVLQLRKHNKEGTLLQLVGFQTRLKWKEQKRIFKMIPCLRNSEFVRYGVIHRNTYIHSPSILERFLNLKNDNDIFFAGQITGVEGYVESIMTGLWISVFIDFILKGEENIPYPDCLTMTGGLLKYLTENNENFIPMNANFGILPSVSIKGKRNKRIQKYERALQSIISLREKYNLKNSTRA